MDGSFTLRGGREALGVFGGRLRRSVRRGRAALARGPAVRSYLESHEVRRLQVGTGHNLLPGWLNTDRAPVPGGVYLDAAEPFPFEDGTFHYVFSEHLIEHLPYDRGLAMLRECRRVLNPGGRVRIATPDLDAIISLKGAPAGGVEERYVRWLTESYFPDADRPSPAYAINQVFRGWGHRFIYDQETLRAALERAGFTGVVRRAFGESDDENLSGIEGHGAEDGNREMSEFETMILEAVRP
jgi:SAM-dependent methyltransferase